MKQNAHKYWSKFVTCSWEDRGNREFCIITCSKEFFKHYHYSVRDKDVSEVVYFHLRYLVREKQSNKPQ